MARKPTSGLALSKIDTDDRTTDLKLRIKGKLSADLQAYAQAYQDTHGQPIELEILAIHMLADYIANDRGFQAWRKGQQAKAAAG